MYTRNNPLRNTDPFGLTPREPCNGSGCEPAPFLPFESDNGLPPIAFSIVPNAEAMEGGITNPGLVHAAQLGSEAAHEIIEGVKLIAEGFAAAAIGVATGHPVLIVAGGVVYVYGSYELGSGLYKLYLYSSLVGPR